MNAVKTKCVPTRVTFQRKGGGTVSFPAVRVVEREAKPLRGVQVTALLGGLSKHVRNCAKCQARINRAAAAIGKIVACAAALLLVCALPLAAQSDVSAVPRNESAELVREPGVPWHDAGGAARSAATAGFPQKPEPKVESWEYAAWAGLAGASHFAVQRDVNSTQRALRLPGFEERTWFARPFVDSPRKHAAAAHAATAGVNALSLWMLRSKRMPWRAMWWVPQLALATVPHVFANRNHRLVRGAQR